MTHFSSMGGGASSMHMFKFTDAADGTRHQSWRHPRWFILMWVKASGRTCSEPACALKSWTVCGHEPELESTGLKMHARIVQQGSILLAMSAALLALAQAMSAATTGELALFDRRLHRNDSTSKWRFHESARHCAGAKLPGFDRDPDRRNSTERPCNLLHDEHCRFLRRPCHG